MGTFLDSNDWWKFTRLKAAALKVFAFRVALSLSSVTQETCSLTDAI